MTFANSDLDAISGKAAAWLRHKANFNRVDATRRDLSSRMTSVATMLEIDVDGTCAPFPDDPQMSAPVASVVSALHRIRQQWPMVEFISGRDAEFMVPRMQRWTLTDIDAKLLYGSQILTWHDGRPTITETDEAKDGRRRLERAWPQIKSLIESRGFELSANAAPGVLYSIQKAHMRDFQIVNLSDGEQARFRRLLETDPAMLQLLEDPKHQLFTKWHASGSAEIKSIDVNKIDIGRDLVTLQRPDGLPRPSRIAFFCDDSGDELLARWIKTNHRGRVIVVYNPPDDRGRLGTPESLLEIADCVLVGGDVAEYIGLSSVARNQLPQDTTGQFLNDLAGDLEMNRDALSRLLERPLDVNSQSRTRPGDIGFS